MDSRQLNECDDAGICLIVSTLKPFEKIEIQEQFILIKNLNGFIGIEK